jgi:hypothetical protein
MNGRSASELELAAKLLIRVVFGVFVAVKERGLRPQTLEVFRNCWPRSGIARTTPDVGRRSTHSQQMLSDPTRMRLS